jgi:opacity protein-like surface antigen
MKKLPVLSLLLLCCTFNLVSQTFHGGILAGFTASQIDGDSYAGYNKTGLQGGIFISTSLTTFINGRFEIKYASRGARNSASDDNTGAYRLGLQYIDLPIVVAARIKQLGSIELGVVPGYLFAIRGEKDDGVLTEEDKATYHKFDLGTIVGANFNISEKIFLNLRYSYSIFSIRDLESAGSYYSWFGKLFGHSKGDFNNYLSLSINYLLK